MMQWEELEETCQSCNRCGLCETRHNVVFGVGVRNADVIFVLRDGSVIEHGSHDELMEAKGFYYSLHCSYYIHTCMLELYVNFI